MNDRLNGHHDSLPAICSLIDGLGEADRRCRMLAHDKKRGKSITPRDVLRVAELEQELEAMRTELQGALRNLRISRKAQAAIKEEAFSVSKEHQSTKRELLASKDELQSLNKELAALKSQVRETLKPQRRGSKDLLNARQTPAGANFVLPDGKSDPRTSCGCHLEASSNSSALIAWRQTAANYIAGLTPRQREIMELVLAGRPSKNIAAHLGISQRTVENHRASIMKKTGSKSLPALTRLAVFAAGSGADGLLILGGLPAIVPQQMVCR